MINLEDKRAFITWLVETITLKEKEAYWILNYLLNHDALLNRVVFVEQADKTPRGLVIADTKASQDGLVLFKETHPFTDAQQIFHEIRMNYKDTLYIEICFENREFNQLYQTVIEDNPFLSAFDLISTEMFHRIEEDFKQKQSEKEVEYLLTKINDAIDSNNQQEFIYWSNEYQKRKNKSDG